MQTSKTSVNQLVQIAIFATVAYLLSFIPLNFMNYAISISLGMIPVALIGLKSGVKAGMLTGFIYGLLTIITGQAAVLGPIQVIIEYIIAFTAGGLAGVFSPKLQATYQQQQSGIKWIIIASIVGTLCRYFWHFIAGFIYWGQYAPEGMSPIWYSFVFNSISGLATAAVTAIALVLIYQANRNLFRK